MHKEQKKKNTLTLSVSADVPFSHLRSFQINENDFNQSRSGLLLIFYSRRIPLVIAFFFLKRKISSLMRYCFDCLALLKLIFFGELAFWLNRAIAHTHNLKGTFLPFVFAFWFLNRGVVVVCTAQISKGIF